MNAGLLDQFGAESLHLAFLAITGGISSAAVIIGWLIRRDIHRSDMEAVEIKLRLACVEQGRIEDTRRTGEEIKLIQYKVGIFATQVQIVIPAVDVPDWPPR